MCGDSFDTDHADVVATYDVPRAYDFEENATRVETPHRELSIARIPIGTVTLKDRTLSPIARFFIEHAREVAKPLAKKKSQTAEPPCADPMPGGAGGVAPFVLQRHALKVRILLIRPLSTEELALKINKTLDGSK
jgi:hypothetical protein